MKMPGWYDIFEMGSIAKGEDKDGLDASKTYSMFYALQPLHSALFPTALGVHYTLVCD